jgi:hypothetical protein
MEGDEERLMSNRRKLRELLGDGKWHRNWECAQEGETLIPRLPLRFAPAGLADRGPLHPARRVEVSPHRQGRTTTKASNDNQGR